MNQVFLQFFDVSNEEELMPIVDKTVADHPYFSIAHFLKLKAGWKNKSFTETQASLAALHFNNLFLLNKRLNEKTSTSLSEKGKKKKGQKEQSTSFVQRTEEVLDIDVTEDLMPKDASQTHEGEVDVHLAEPIVNNATQEIEVNNAEVKETLLDNLEDEKPLVENAYPAEQMHEGEVDVHLAEPIVNNATQEIEVNTAEVKETLLDKNLEDKNQMAENAYPAEQMHEGEVDVHLAEPIVNNATQEIEVNTEEVKETLLENKQEAGNPPAWATKILNAPTPKGDILFEPLHTTDYFASQGIKITDEYKSAQGDQRKSFTDWLRTMKRLNTGYKTDAERPLDNNVEQLAQKSNLEQAVITEAMAETFVAQGKTKKAIEVFEKLSLQNPSKSAYFAAKIKSLK